MSGGGGARAPLRGSLRLVRDDTQERALRASEADGVVSVAERLGLRGLRILLLRIFHQHICSLSLFHLCRCVVDKFHEPNHAWCSPDFFASSYKDALMLGTNTQSAEQTNSVLAKIRGVLFFMKASNALSLLSVTIAHYNNKAGKL